MARSNTPRQTAQSEPNPELQAALTDPEVDRQEQHVVDDAAPSPADERSAEAPGIRTEAEVVADHRADNERAAAALAANGHTADPAVSTSAVKLPRVENRDVQVWFKNRITGRIDSVNEGTPEHGVVLTDGDLEVLDSKPSKADIEKANA